MKKALVLGATGGMGYSIVNELINRGIEVIAFARNEKQLIKMFRNHPEVNLHPGDVFQVDSLEKAAKEVDVIFQAINLPYYDWYSKLLPMTENVITVAKKVSAKIAVVDNIYAYGKNTGKKVTEKPQKNRTQEKGNYDYKWKISIKDLMYLISLLISLIFMDHMWKMVS